MKVCWIVRNWRNGHGNIIKVCTSIEAIKRCISNYCDYCILDAQEYASEKEVKEEQQRKIEVEEFYEEYFNKNKDVEQPGRGCCCGWIEVTCFELD